MPPRRRVGPACPAISGRYGGIFSMPTTPPPMTDFSALTPGTYVSGLAASGPVEVLAVEMHGASAATVTWAEEDGRTDRRVIYGDVLAGLRIVEPGRRWAF